MLNTKFYRRPSPPAQYQPTQKSRRMYRRHAGPGSLGQEGLTGIDLHEDLHRRSHARQQNQGMAQVTPKLQETHDQQAVQNTGQSTVVAQRGITPPQPGINTDGANQQGQE